jgi:DNA-binding NarL/FixJ family response regulator
VKHRRRVLLLGMPHFLRELIGKIVAQEDDLALVGEIEDGDLLAATASADADFVIVGVDDPACAEPYLDLLEQRPRTKVLALSGDGRDAVLWDLHPRLVALGEASPATVLVAIRIPDWTHAGVVG